MNEQREIMRQPYAFIDDNPQTGTPPQKHNPGDEYGTVIVSRGSLAVRQTGNVFSIWSDDRMEFTSTNEAAVDMFVKGLRSI